MLLATEKSDKAKGTVSEEATAAKMMFLAKKRNSVPKDLGIDLLLLKDKRNRETAYDEAVEKNVQVIEAEKQDLTELDALGSFTILVDRVNEFVVALHYTLERTEKPDKIIKGKTTDAIYSKIVQLGLVSRADHAAYLGSELEKAEIALRTGKEYIQDKAMFAR